MVLSIGNIGASLSLLKKRQMLRFQAVFPWHSIDAVLPKEKHSAHFKTKLSSSLRFYINIASKYQVQAGHIRHYPEKEFETLGSQKVGFYQWGKISIFYWKMVDLFRWEIQVPISKFFILLDIGHHFLIFLVNRMDDTNFNYNFFCFALNGHLPNRRKWISHKGFCLTSGKHTNVPTSLGQVNPNTAAAGNRTRRLAQHQAATRTQADWNSVCRRRNLSLRTALVEPQV